MIEKIYGFKLRGAVKAVNRSNEFCIFKINIVQTFLENLNFSVKNLKWSTWSKSFYTLNYDFSDFNYFWIKMSKK